MPAWTDEYGCSTRCSPRTARCIAARDEVSRAFEASTHGRRISSVQGGIARPSAGDPVAIRCGLNVVVFKVRGCFSVAAFCLDLVQRFQDQKKAAAALWRSSTRSPWDGSMVQVLSGGRGDAAVVVDALRRAIRRVGRASGGPSWSSYAVPLLSGVAFRVLVRRWWALGFDPAGARDRRELLWLRVRSLLLVADSASVHHAAAAGASNPELAAVAAAAAGRVARRSRAARGPPRRWATCARTRALASSARRRARFYVVATYAAVRVRASSAVDRRCPSPRPVCARGVPDSHGPPGSSCFMLYDATGARPAPGAFSPDDGCAGGGIVTASRRFTWALLALFPRSSVYARAHPPESVSGWRASGMRRPRRRAALAELANLDGRDGGGPITIRTRRASTGTRRSFRSRCRSSITADG